MSILEFEYRLDSTFSLPVKEHEFLLRCLPLSDSSQMSDGVSAEIFPRSRLWRSAGTEKGTLMGSVDFEHERFTVVTRGRVVRREGAPSDKPHPMYNAFTPLTAPCASLKELATKYATERADFSFAENMMRRVHELIEYTPDVTSGETSASEALKLGKGVCQDYAHIFCTLMRLIGIPTRYVAGLGSAPGETHAWNECYIGGRWHGFDCTHNNSFPDGYVKLAQGMDAQQCALNRGVFTNVVAGETAKENQKVSARVRRIGS